MVSIAIVRSRFNEEITGKMLENAKRRAKRLGVHVAYIVEVPGAFDMPVVVKKLLGKKSVDGVACIGAIIKGSTKHDELIAYQLSRAFVTLSLEYGKPIGLGVMGPGITWNLAKKRIKQYSEQSVEAVLRVHEELGKIR